MDRFIQESAGVGRLSQENQGFTLTGAKLRETLLKSVPPDRDSLYRGLLYLADAVTWLGLTTGPALQFMSDNPQVSAVHYAKSVPQVLLDKGPDWFKERYDRPFTSQDPLDLAWDRAWLRLLAKKIPISVGLLSLRHKANWNVNLTPEGLEEGQAQVMLGAKAYLWLPPVPAPRSYTRFRNLEDRLRVGRGTLLSLGPSGSLWSECWEHPLRSNWYVGRSKSICLYERLVEGSPDGGGLSCDVKPDTTATTLPSEQPGIFERQAPRGFLRRMFGSEELRVSTRRWITLDQRPPQGKMAAKAIFSVALDDSVASVDFFKHGFSLETVEFPEGPRGLIGVVHWPELQTDLWGESFVHNMEWERALDWTGNQLKEVWQDLRSQRDHLLSEICGNQTKAAYRHEVRKKLEETWFEQGLTPEVSSLSHPESPEERAEKIRSRLGY